ncbi:MAG: SDR family NAD(P)-dependent oxidoreductase [Steroidobacteraceae bacterium]
MSLDRLDSRYPSKRALITGAASGLGLATAGLLAARGWRLGLLDRDADALAAAAVELRTGGSPLCEIHAVDTTDETAVKSAVDNFAARCDGLDLAMNSAGVAVAGSLLETPAADWDWIVNINLLGVAHCCRAELPQLVASGGGIVINIASAASFACAGRMGAYNASKAAVVALSETLYQEFADRGVHVAVAMPGFFRTRLMDRARAPADAAKFAWRMMEASNLEADAVAREIVARAAAGATHIVLPARYRWLWRFKRLAPGAYLRWMTSLQRRYARHAAARRVAK